MKKIILLSIAMFGMLGFSIGQPIMVTNTNNNGLGTLREAIYEANYQNGPDTIMFNIPGPGPHIINLNGDLPQINERVFIDGFSQPGSKANTNGKEQASNAEMKIVLNGTHSPGPNLYGLSVYGNGTKIQGLVFNNFNMAHIIVYHPNVVIVGNYLGIDVEGNNAVGFATFGVVFQETDHCTLGGTAPESRNVIAGSETHVHIKNSDHITLSGNYIGVNAAGTTQIQPYGINGIVISGSDNATIGGDYGNLISGNSYGIFINENSEYLSITGNYIGTNAEGISSISNSTGIYIVNGYMISIGGPEENDRNVISGNFGPGIHAMEQSENLQMTVQGNYIGLAANGSSPLGNHTGILVESFNNIIGDPDHPNNIGYNSIVGIAITNGIENRVCDNQYIGNTIGIDLGNDGPTENDISDLDNGPNNLINTPVFYLDYTNNEGDLVIDYWVDCGPGTASYPLLVNFFESGTTGAPQGERHIGSDWFYFSDWSNISKTVNFGNAEELGIQTGDVIVGTTTDAPGNTSEFSTGSIVNSVKERNSILQYATLNQNIPNPANGATIIPYSIKKKMDIKLDIFDLQGQHIISLINQSQNPGQYEIDFDTRKLEGGVYYYRLSNGLNAISKKMLITP